MVDLKYSDFEQLKAVHIQGHIQVGASSWDMNVNENVTKQ